MDQKELPSSLRQWIIQLVQCSAHKEQKKPTSDARLWFVFDVNLSINI